MEVERYVENGGQIVFASCVIVVLRGSGFGFRFSYRRAVARAQRVGLRSSVFGLRSCPSSIRLLKKSGVKLLG